MTLQTSQEFSIERPPAAVEYLHPPLLGMVALPRPVAAWVQPEAPASPLRPQHAPRALADGFMAHADAQTGGGIPEDDDFVEAARRWLGTRVLRDGHSEADAQHAASAWNMPVITCR